MEHVRALIIKVLMIGVITMLVLSLFRGLRPADSIAIAIVITLVTYVLGDLLILPAYGNLAASASNGVIAFLIAWLTPFVAANIRITFGNALSVGVLVGLADWFYHKYVGQEILDSDGQKDT